jgi:hypothetical protein
MAVRTIVGVVVETEPDDEEVVSLAIETPQETYIITPPEMAEELLEEVGHRVEVTGTVIEREDASPLIDVDSYLLLYDEDDEEEEEEEGRGPDDEE